MRRIPVLLAVLSVSLLLVNHSAAQSSNKVNLQDLLPKEAIGYVHIQDIQKTAAQVREAAMKRLPAEEVRKFDSQIKQVMAMATMGAMNAGIDLNKALGEVQEVHAVLLDIVDSNSPPPFVLAVESVSDGYIDTLVQAVAKQQPPMQQSDHKGVKVTKWFEDQWSKFALYSIVIGKVGILSNSEEALKKMIDARAAKGGNRLSDNSFLAKARGMKGEGKHLVSPRYTSYGFLDVNQMLTKIKKTLRDRDKKDFEMADAVFEFTKIKALTWAATVEGDITTCEAEVTFGSEAEFYDVVRQEPGELKSLKFVPEDAIMYGAGRLSNPEKTWKRLREFLADREDEMGMNIAEWEDVNIRRYSGTSFQEILKHSRGDVVAFLLPKMHNVKDWRRREPIYAWCLQIDDPVQVEEILKAIAKAGGSSHFAGGIKEEVKKETYKGVELYLGREDTSSQVAAYVFLDKHFIFSNSHEGVKKAIDAFKDGKSIVKVKNHEAVLKKTGTNISKLFYMDMEGMMKWKMNEVKQQGGRGHGPDMAMVTTFFTGFQSTFATVEQSGRMRIISSSSGPFSWAFSAAPASYFFGMMAPLMMDSHIPSERPIDDLPPPAVRKVEKIIEIEPIEVPVKEPVPPPQPPPDPKREKSPDEK